MNFLGTISHDLPVDLNRFDCLVEDFLILMGNDGGFMGTEERNVGGSEGLLFKSAEFF